MGQQVQVSSLTGSCPYQPFVAPSDRLKVGAHLEYIDDNGLFYLLPFPVLTVASDGEGWAWKVERLISCQLISGFLFYLLK